MTSSAVFGARAERVVAAPLTRSISSATSSTLPGLLSSSRSRAHSSTGSGGRASISTRIAQRHSEDVLLTVPGIGAFRVPLDRLSFEAVARSCAATPMNAKALYVATSGNPFFVTEVLASGGIGVPTTVRDAILARVEGLADTTRRSLELLSVIPGHAKRGLAEQLLEERAGLEEAERRGFLVADEPGSIEKQ